MVFYNYVKELNDDSFYKENNFCFVEFQVMNGFILLVVMKYFSNLICLLIIVCVMSVNIVLFMVIFLLQFNFYFNVVFILVIVVLKFYYS